MRTRGAANQRLDPRRFEAVLDILVQDLAVRSGSLAAARLSRASVGEGFQVASDGKTPISRDGLRQYRPPAYKSALKRFQANFEQRPLAEGAWGSNGHLDIIK